jgi:hypothetical protein
MVFGVILRGTVVLALIFFKLGNLNTLIFSIKSPFNSTTDRGRAHQPKKIQRAFGASAGH